jgi:chromosome partitioning protein
MAGSGRLIAMANLKGEVGKTTLAVSLACALPGRVVVADADGQAGAVVWASEGKPPVEVIPLPLTEEGSKASTAWLARLVKMKSGFDFVVVDMPSNLGAATLAALGLADLILLPVSPSALDLKATARTLALLRQAREVRKDGKPAALLVPSRVDRPTGAGRAIEAVLHYTGEPVAPAINQRATHVDAFSAGQWIGAYAPRSVGHVEIEARAALVKKIAAR